MTILFSAKLSVNQQKNIQANFPGQSFIFCAHMDEAKDQLANAEVLVTYGEDLDADLIENATKLKWIMVISAGMDRMPFEAIAQRDIIVTNVRGIHRVPMAEYAISMLLQVFRQEKQLIANEQKHTWDRTVRAQEISGKTMLIVGIGAIGQEVARLAKAFRMKTYGISRSGRPVEWFDKVHAIQEMGQLLTDADFVVSVLPSTAETKYLFTFEHFQQLPSHAVFLNMGRGDVVGSDVILKAVREKEIAHAVLDVFEIEPLPADHPFWEEENITVTPHLSGISPHYLPRALEIFEHNLRIYLGSHGEMVNKINVARGY